MHIHILGICGTFMGSLALLARELGYRVTGVDQQVYPPMSSQLEASGIELFEGYEKHGLDTLTPDAVIIGNALSRGNPAVEYVLESGLLYYSGPQWLAQHVLQGKTVLAVAGTHGKTTTASMLAWILECAGKTPGFLIGGVPENFSLSARLGESEYFVIEADEYDSAFFDKRSKFVHYRPQVLVLNNLEFDHADIFDDLAAIQRQFHHVVRTVPASGCILMPGQKVLHEVIEQGLWSQLEMLSGAASPWCVSEQSADQGQFRVMLKAQTSTEQSIARDSGVVSWNLCGAHNISNAVAAIAAAHKIGVPVATSAKALGSFSNVKRRLQLLDKINGIRVYDDFAHHPSAIKTTLEGLAAKYPEQKIIAIIEPRSNTMRMGVHNNILASAIKKATNVWWCSIENPEIFAGCEQVNMVEKVDEIVEQVADYVTSDDVIVIMSNGGFNGIHQKLIFALRNKYNITDLS